MRRIFAPLIIVLLSIPLVLHDSGLQSAWGTAGETQTADAQATATAVAQATATAAAAGTQTAAAQATLTAAPRVTQTAAAVATATANAVATATARAVATAATLAHNDSLDDGVPILPLSAKRAQMLRAQGRQSALDLEEFLKHATRTIQIAATNATALGRRDIGTVVAIEAFTTSSGAPATKTLLHKYTDFTVGGGDVTPVGDHSAETWIIHYRP